MEMHFTESDKARLVENRNAICKYIMDEIVPYLGKDDRVKVDFGDAYNSPRSWDSTTDYHFAVYGTETNFYLNGNNGSGYIGYGERFGGISYPFNKITNPYYIYSVVENWGMIKSSMLNQIAENKNKRRSIYSFEV